MTSAVYSGRKPINQYSFSFVDSQSARSSGTERGPGRRQCLSFEYWASCSIFRIAILIINYGPLMVHSLFVDSKSARSSGTERGSRRRQVSYGEHI